MAPSPVSYPLALPFWAPLPGRVSSDQQLPHLLEKVEEESTKYKLVRVVLTHFN